MEVRDTLTKTPPRTLSISACPEVIHLFVGGSLERGVAGLGAILFDVKTKRGRAWQGKAPQAVLDGWKKEVGDFLICQIETYVALCVREFLADLLHQRRVIILV